VHRANTSRLTVLVGRAAAAVGAAVRWVGSSAGNLTGLVGAGAVSYGAGQIYSPLLPIVAGGFLLAIARNLR